MDNILLINTDTCHFAKVYPIGLDYLTSVLEEHGYSVDKLDLAFIDKDKWLESAQVLIRDNNYLAVGIGIRNLYDEIYHGKNYLPEIIEFVKDLKKILRQRKSAPKIILGGSGFSLIPQIVLDETGADFGVINEGEQAFIDILKIIYTNETIKKQIFSGPVDLTKQKYRRGSWGNFHGYFKQNASGNLQTKRGCPMKCLYCEYPVIEGTRFRFRDPTIVAEEFLQLELLGFPRIYIVDATFNNPLYQAKDILKAFKKAGTKKEWTAFFNPKLLDQELISMIKETNGGKPFKLTIESGSDEMLKTLRKNLTVKDIYKAVSLCRKNRMDFSFTVLFGGPGENEKTVKETCDLIKKCQPVYVSMNIGLYLHPQTPIAQINKGKLWSKESDFLNPIIYPCERDKIKSWINKYLADSGISFNLYEGGEK